MPFTKLREVPSIAEKFVKGAGMWLDLIRDSPTIVIDATTIVSTERVVDGLDKVEGGIIYC